MATKELNKQRKMELASVMTYLMDAQTKNRQVIEHKLSSHHERIKSMLAAYEKSTKE